MFDWIHIKIKYSKTVVGTYIYIYIYVKCFKTMDIQYNIIPIRLYMQCKHIQLYTYIIYI